MRWPFFNRKENPVNQSIVALYGGGAAIWTPKDYWRLAKAGYEECAAAFACVKLIASTASRIPWYVARRDAQGNMNEFESHPLLDLLNRPNEVESGATFTEKILAHFLLAGNSYILGVRGTPSQPPSFLYVLRPDRVQPIADKSGRQLVSGYRYTGAFPKDFAAEEIMHLRDFHPTHDFLGLSRLEVSGKYVDIMNQAAEWNKKVFQNDMRPPGMLTTESAVDWTAFKKIFREEYQGYENAGTPLVIRGKDITWTDLTKNPKDMDWLDGQKFTLRQICAIFGVASELLGDSENKTYSNIQEARKGLYLETILPLLNMIRDEYQRWLAPAYGQGIVLDYNTDAIPELAEDRSELAKTLDMAWWIKVNEKRVAMGWDEVPGADVMMIPVNLIPFGPSSDVVPPPAATGKMATKMWREPVRAKALWTAFEQRTRSRERSFLALAQSYLRGQAERVKEAVKGTHIHTLHADTLFSQGEETKRYVDHFWPWYRDHFVRAGNAGKHAAKGEIFDDGEFKADNPTSWTFTMTPAQEAKLREMVFESGTKVNTTTIETIYAELLDAQATNMTVAEFARSIYEKVEGFTRGRAMTWAATESAKTDNYGQLEGYRDSAYVDGKGWLCSFLPTSRQDHEDISGTEIGIDDYFDLGDGSKMLYPGDPSGNAGEVINCRCSLYPVTD